MEQLIIDRFEGEFALCEKEDKHMIQIAITALPVGSRPGDCVLLREDGALLPDKARTEARKARMQRLLDDLFE